MGSREFRALLDEIERACATFGSFEVVYVDDGSADATAADFVEYSEGAIRAVNQFAWDPATATLTLDVTLNPDFGQVEVDPSVVNLSAFETFFPEKRPFFLEGSDIFDFGLGLGNSSGSSSTVLASAPHFVDRRQNKHASMIGAIEAYPLNAYWIASSKMFAYLCTLSAITYAMIVKTTTKTRADQTCRTSLRPP